MIRFTVISIFLCLAVEAQATVLEFRDLYNTSHCEEVIPDHISFMLYTRLNPDVPLFVTEGNVNDSLNFDKETKFILHGYNFEISKWVFDVKDDFLRKGDHNCILVDWSNYTTHFYNDAICYGKKVGKIVADFVTGFQFDIKRVDVIGHSLGSQLAGYVGQEIQINTGGVKLPRIVGLDAAGPWFSDQPDELRLSPDDAEFVLGIHTNQGVYGLDQPYAHVDFYPNGGRAQPGCELELLPENCHHRRAPIYFGESISSNLFVAVSCDSYENFTSGLCDSNPKVVMGEECPRTARGLYFLQTNSQEPFALGDVFKEAYNTSVCEEVSPDKIIFELFTRSNPDDAIILTQENIDSSIDFEKETKFIFHGWDFTPSGWIYGAKDAFLLKGDFNVIITDWSLYTSSHYFYTDSICFSRKIGKLVADMITDNRFDLKKVNLIGQSLGGQLVGYIGQEVQSNTGGIKLPRITGLDAAGPWFSYQPNELRLSPDDAEFVLGIHTDQGFYGLDQPYGHADFYPNGGRSQPGCESETLPDNCNHSRAPKLFVESINSDLFVSTLCGSYDNFTSGLCNDNPTAVMGENCISTARGSYFLRTNSEAPFALGGL